ncbi:hypothetical protein [Candidatus Microthrix parvicella]|uniref:hypothetical protein n=1 Tax=Candidatus Neomicrothrix parvicella TaxID=41950 RepID=UPI0004AEE8B4|nr:hypothetical protein [Candidatus Microthrix parvicella]
MTNPLKQTRNVALTRSDGSSAIGVDEVTARHLERLTQTSQGNPAGWSKEKK